MHNTRLILPGVVCFLSLIVLTASIAVNRHSKSSVDDALSEQRRLSEDLRRAEAERSKLSRDLNTLLVTLAAAHSANDPVPQNPQLLNLLSPEFASDPNYAPLLGECVRARSYDRFAPLLATLHLNRETQARLESLLADKIFASIDVNDVLSHLGKSSVADPRMAIRTALIAVADEIKKNFGDDVARQISEYERLESTRPYVDDVWSRFRLIGDTPSPTAYIQLMRAVAEEGPNNIRNGQPFSEQFKAKLKDILTPAQFAQLDQSRVERECIRLQRELRTKYPTTPAGLIGTPK